MSALEMYLNWLHDMYEMQMSVAETSYYPVFQKLLNDIGGGLKPAVNALVHLKNTGAGIPDMGLFDETQAAEQKPAHGIVEAKPFAEDLNTLAHSEQVRRYVAHYGQALVTNY